MKKAATFSQYKRAISHFLRKLPHRIKSRSPGLHVAARMIAFSQLQWHDSHADSMLTVTGSLGIHTRFPIIPQTGTFDPRIIIIS